MTRKKPDRKRNYYKRCKYMFAFYFAPTGAIRSVEKNLFKKPTKERKGDE